MSTPFALPTLPPPQALHSHVVLTLSGAIGAADLAPLADALDRLVERPLGGTVVIDLSHVGSWSLLAQGMILSTARIISRRGGRLVLRGPSNELRLQSRHLDIFGRVATRGRSAKHPHMSAGIC